MIASVGKRRTFHLLRTEGRRVRHGAVRVNYLRLAESSATDEPEVAFAIGRSFGNAVQRNRGRRRLRAAFLHAWAALPVDRRRALRGAFLLSGHRGLLSSPFDRLCDDVAMCLAALGSEPHLARSDAGQ